MEGAEPKAADGGEGIVDDNEGKHEANTGSFNPI